MLTKSRPWKTSTATPLVTAAGAGAASPAAATTAAAPMIPERAPLPRAPVPLFLNTDALPKSVISSNRLHGGWERSRSPAQKAPFAFRNPRDRLRPRSTFASADSGVRGGADGAGGALSHSAAALPEPARSARRRRGRTVPGRGRTPPSVPSARSAAIVRADRVARRADGAHELVGRCVLEEVADRACIHRFGDPRTVMKRREHHHAYLGRHGDDPAGGGHAVQPRHR